MIPRWVTYAALAAFLIGVATVVLGPMVLYAVASARVDTKLTPAERFDESAVQEAMMAELETAREQFTWVFPVGCGLGFCGMIALMLVWVSRPLGSDLDDADPGSGG